MKQRHVELIGIFLGSLFIFTCGLSHQEIIGFDSRFYLFALEMWRHGFSWFPTTYQQPYPDYPGTSTWLIYLCSLVGGGLSKLTAILPSAMMAAITVTLTYLIGENNKKRWGLFAVCLLLMTAGFVREARSISLDMYITAITTACYYLLSSADKQKKPTNSFYLAALLVTGFFIRGPIGLVIPTSVICTYELINKRLRQAILKGLMALILLIACFAALLTLAHHVGGNTFVQDVLRMQMAGRVGNDFLPKYFYFVAGQSNYALAFPFGFLVLLTALYYRFNRTHENIPTILYSLAGWFLIVLIGMSIPGEKKIRYILPLIPAAALLASYPLVAAKDLRLLALIRFILSRLTLLLPGILMLGLMYVYQDLPASAWTIEGHYFTTMMCLGFLQLGSYIAWKNFHNYTRTTIIATIAFLLVYIYMFEAGELHVEQAAPFVSHTEILREGNASALYFYDEEPDGLPIKYLINMTNEVTPIFLHNLNELTQLKKDMLVIIRDAEYKQLPQNISQQFTIVNHDTMGHVKMVVIKKRK